MEVLAYGIFGAAVYYIVAYFLGRARADAVIAEIQVQPTQEAIKAQEEIAVVTKEVEDAKIEYKNARDTYYARLATDASAASQSGDGSGQTEPVSGSPGESGRSN